MTKPIAIINELLQFWATLTPPVIDFTVENVLSAIKYEATYDYVLRLLMSKDGFEINISRIYLCPENHKAHQCKLDEDIDDFDLPQCHVCGEEIINDLDHSFIVFNFSKDFIEDAKKKAHHLGSLNDQNKELVNQSQFNNLLMKK
ncbi:hypothetical protein ACM1RC_28280 [Paenibacillus azoreducens]|uniref:hypothetical protein n=1 Tax=Paenibacillus azoreducens TaxID=116718 RepID=UPI0039F571FA